MNPNESIEEPSERYFSKTKPAGPAPTEAPQPSEAEIKRTARRLKVIQYRARGMTDEEICEALRKNDQIEVSLRTIWEDRHSDIAQDFVDELVRQQLTDINTCDEKETKLTFRQSLIESLKPNKKAAVEVNVNQTNTQSADVKGSTNALIQFSRQHTEITDSK